MKLINRPFFNSDGLVRTYRSYYIRNSRSYKRNPIQSFLSNSAFSKIRSYHSRKLVIASKLASMLPVMSRGNGIFHRSYSKHRTS